jgi:hypothetical protein
MVLEKPHDGADDLKDVRIVLRDTTRSPWRIDQRTTLCTTNEEI